MHDRFLEALRRNPNVKAGAEDNPGLKPIADQLGDAFKKANAKPATPTPAK